MSQKYYKMGFQNQREKLKETVAMDQIMLNKKIFSERHGLIQSLQKLYIRYAEIANNLCDVFDNVRDPIVADQSQRLYEVTVARLLQVKEELTKTEGDIYSFMDDLLLEQKLSPYQIQLKIPLSYFIEKEKKQFVFHTLIDEMKLTIDREYNSTPSEEQDAEIASRTLSPVASLQVLPPLIRASVYSENFNEINMMETIKQKKLKDALKYKATLIICMYFKIYLVKIKRRELILMVKLETESYFKERNILAKLRNQHFREEEKLRSTSKWIRTKEHLENRYKEKITEDIEDEIREWYFSFYDLTQEFPDLPPDTLVYACGQKLGVRKKISKMFAEKYFRNPDVDWPTSATGLSLAKAPQFGGSALIQTGNWVTAEEYLLCKAQFKAKKKKTNPRKERKIVKPKKEKNKQFTIELKDTECLPIFRRLEDDMRNFENIQSQQEEEETQLKYDIFKAINLELRENVDNEFREELRRLKASAEQKKRGHKRRKNRKRRKKKKKGLVGESTPEMVKNLVKNSIIRKGNYSKLNDYRGERRLLPPPSPNCPGDIVDQLLYYGILPLASSTIHRLAPLTRSICLIGPKHSAKQFLTDILVTETGASLFDLSPENLMEIYETKEELKLLRKSITLTARKWQPSIIFINNVESLFYKRVPKEERAMRPKRLRNVVTKLIKDITSETEVLVVATSSQPWLAKIKQFLKTFDKLIIVPSPSYGTYSLEWKQFFTAVSIPLEHTPFAKVDASINVGFHGIRQMEQNVLPAGIDQKDNEDLMIANFAMLKPPKNIEKKYNKFLSRTLLAKKKKKLNEMDLEQQKNKKRR